MMKKFALMVAGGSGSRMNAPVPKQFLLLNGKPVLMHTLQRFFDFDPLLEFIVVLPGDQISVWEILCREYGFSIGHKRIEGGDTRFGSVWNGLNSIPDSEGIVFIHDGVRPLVSQATLQRCLETTQLKGNALPVLPLVESVREVKGSKNFPADRSRLYSVQTPQVFRLEEIRAAYALGYDPAFTDDTMVLERLGKTIHLVEGNRENIKITHAEDLFIAEAFLK
ncbi:MAG TPA: 2-C-methyl-D-erythritol 4-phosphate cytidylyltransferase [Prolixibacteraceae bacterium]|nr:2-C-methyl-D-erythritol 4-phosphate cytidylyltransferase [Prolixibacteraceae bacterium]